MSLADDILAINDHTPTPVEAWGKQMVILPMSGTDRDSYDMERYAALKDGKTPESFRAKYIVRCLFLPDPVDGKYVRVFTNEQAEELGRKRDNGFVDEIVRLWQIATGISKTGEGAVEQAAKNS